MKKGLLFLIICLFSSHLFSQDWVSCGSQNPASPSVKLLSNSQEEISVSFTLGGFYKDEVITPFGLQYTITVPKMASMLEEGSPDLPLFAIPMLINDLAKMKVEVDKAQYQDFEDIEIAPSKGNLSREIDPEIVPYPYGVAYSIPRTKHFGLSFCIQSRNENPACLHPADFDDEKDERQRWRQPKTKPQIKQD